MIYPNKCFYTISGFLPPYDTSSPLGGYGFSIGLNAKFAKKCIEFKVNDYVNERVISDGKNVHTRIFNYCHCNPYHFIIDEKNDNYTGLLNFVTVSGNACDLGICGSTIDDIMKMNDNDLVEFHSHNVDSIKQAYALLSLWLFWYDFIYSNLDFNKDV